MEKRRWATRMDWNWRVLGTGPRGMGRQVMGGEADGEKRKWEYVKRGREEAGEVEENSGAVV